MKRTIVCPWSLRNLANGSRVRFELNSPGVGGPNLPTLTVPTTLTITPMQYSSSPSMSNPVSLAAATRQFVPVAANSVVYVQEGISGPITMLIAP